MRPKSKLLRESQRVNQLLREEAEELQLGTKQSLARMEQAKNDASAFSYWAEMEFREYVRRALEKHRAINAVALINGGARMLGLSPVTTKRYMAKLRSENGPFGGLGDIVIVNPNYVPKEEDAYWQESSRSRAMPRAPMEGNDGDDERDVRETPVPGRE